MISSFHWGAGSSEVVLWEMLVDFETRIVDHGKARNVISVAARGMEVLELVGTLITVSMLSSYLCLGAVVGWHSLEGSPSDPSLHDPLPRDCLHAPRGGRGGSLDYSVGIYLIDLVRDDRVSQTKSAWKRTSTDSVAAVKGARACIDRCFPRPLSSLIVVTKPG